ncbi:MAG: hypothetical protein AAFX41_16080 [Bacteroidota bacterium]
MNHFTLPVYWKHYHALPDHVRALADKQFKLLQENPSHPSLQFKKVGDWKQLWSVRVGLHYRALGMDKPEGVVWIWIGSHADYDQILG